MFNIGIVDYGMGNLKSVSNALLSLDYSHSLVNTPEDLGNYDKLILPGVGAFSHAIDNLHQSGMYQALNEYYKSGKYILGICLGMQLICRDSAEDGQHSGLNWVSASVKRFPDMAGFKIPHMGWNAIEIQRDDPIFNEVETGADVYFVHSYYVDCDNDDDILALTEHSARFVSIVRKDNVYGMQFHPEKSQHVGIQLIKNFLLL